MTPEERKKKTEYMRVWRSRPENKEKIKNIDKKCYEKHKEKHRLWGIKYRILNKEKLRKHKKEYYDNNPNRRLINAKTHWEKYGKIFNIKSRDYKYALHAWSKTVRKRDNNQCQVCGSHDKVVSHHILYKQFYPKLSLNANNGITLCKIHHDEVHWKNLDIQ